MTDPRIWQEPPAYRETNLRATGARLRYEDIFGARSSSTEIVVRLVRYSLREVLDYLGRMSSVLHDADSDEKIAESQRAICGMMFPTRGRFVWGRLQQLASTQPSEATLLFDEIMIGLAAKFALHVLNPDTEPTEHPPDDLGEALLMVSSLVESPTLTPTDELIQSEEAWNDWVYYQYVVGAMTSNDLPVHLLARTYDLFLRDHDLPRCTLGVSSPALVEEATGLTPLRLWAVLFAFTTHYMAIASNVLGTRAVLSRRDYLARYFSAEEIDKFFAVVARSAEELATEVDEHFSLEDPRPHDLLPLAKSPLVLVGDLAICPYFRLLLDRMTNGLYHILLNAKPANTPEGRRSRNQYQIFVGTVWEDYVDRLLRRAFGVAGAGAPAYVGPGELEQTMALMHQGNRVSVCDHLIVYGTKAVVIDTKAQFLPLAVRAGADRAAFVDRFASLVLDGVRQLDATVRHLREGHFDREGIVGRDIDQVFPVLVSLADYPMQPMIYDWLRRRVEAAGLLTNAITRPLEILMAGDIDLLEQPLGAGTTSQTFSARS